MKTMLACRAVRLVPLAALLLGKAGGAVEITGLSLTETSVGFSISGYLPSPAPGSANQLYFYNPTVSANPGFVVANFNTATDVSFSGSQTVDLVSTSITGDDYFVIVFQNAFSGDESLSGDFSATWSSPVFDPEAIAALEVYWGSANAFGAPKTGTHLLTVPVPEPVTVLLLFAGAPVFLKRRRPMRQPVFGNFPKVPVTIVDFRSSGDGRAPSGGAA